MLYLIGLGLADETDITVKGLNIVRSAARVYLEAYTSILLVPPSTLEAYYGRPVILADREMVETRSDEILAGAGPRTSKAAAGGDDDKSENSDDIAFLVVGDPFSATTHSDLVLRARQFHIPVRSIPNASILSAIGATGLQLYNFGQTVSMVFFTDTWKPASFYDRVRENRAVGLHTLVLLDIKVKEASEENLARGRAHVYEPPRYMTVGQCAGQMLEVEEEVKREGVYGRGSLAVGVARMGARDQEMVAGTLEQLVHVDLGAPLHSLVLLGSRTHEMEREFIRAYAVDEEVFDRAWEENQQK